MTSGSTTYHVTSPDGSRIGLERAGEGPDLLVIHGGTADRMRWATVRDALAERFTLHLMDRRGRGLSLDEADAPYGIEREAQDVGAVVHALGGSADVLAHSYGATCALEAVAAGASIARLLAYEPPAGSGERAIVAPELLGGIEGLVAAGRREEALEIFMRDVIAVPPEQIAVARTTPMWQRRLEILPTLSREAHALNAHAIAPERFAGTRTRVRFLLGSATAPGLDASTRAFHDAIDGSDLVVLDGEGHVAMDTAPERFVAEVEEFFAR